MSLGYEGCAKIISQDKDVIIYAYSDINLNEKGPLPFDAYDGKIYINRKCFLKSSIKRRIMKSIVKIMPDDYDLQYLYDNKEIVIEPSKNDFIRIGYGRHYYISLYLLLLIFAEFEKNDIIPAKVSFFNKMFFSKLVENKYKI